MRRRLWALVWAALCVSSAYAGNPRAAVAASFICNGTTSGPCPQGGNPNSLIQGSDGNFYGTATNSGDSASGQFILGGTVFSVTPAGKFTVLHTFSPGTNGKYANGDGPVQLTEGPDGKLYGLTAGGGNGVGAQFSGYGVLFRVNKNGSGFQVIHRFCSQGLFCTDGASPVGLAVGGDGDLYGATMQGGSSCPGEGCGTIFRVTPSTGAYDVMLSFTSAYEGFPAGLTPAADGSLYGLTVNGNALFHYVPGNDTAAVTQLSFPLPTGCPGFACSAVGSVTFGSNGNLYGFYTVYDVPGAGGIFEMQPDGSHLTVFPQFTTTAGPGLQLLFGSDGNLWFSQATGSSRRGNIVALTPSTGAIVKNLAPFNASAFAPVGIVEAKDGTLWGVSSGGIVTGAGHFADGAVFKVNAGLPPR